MAFTSILEQPRLNIAVIGCGIAGMSAAWLLSQKHEVTVYEKNTRLGGHSNTVMVNTDAGLTPVDTGFIVYNDITYPNLIALFEHLGVETKQSTCRSAYRLVAATKNIPASASAPFSATAAICSAHVSGR